MHLWAFARRRAKVAEQTQGLLRKSIQFLHQRSSHHQRPRYAWMHEISARTALVRRHLLPDYFQQPICWAAPPWPQGARRGGCGLSGGGEPRSSGSPPMNARGSRRV